MKKTAAAAVLAAAMLLTLTGCGSSMPNASYALITDEQGVSDKTTSAIWTGIETYASSMGTSAGRYEAKDSEENSLSEAVRNAADAGAKTIVCQGADMETTVHAAQKKYGKVKFILIGGVPRENAGAAEDIADNTICITYDEGQAAFLAGYGCVTEGRRSLGYMAGIKTDEAVEFEAGFISGAEAAAADLALGEGSVTISVDYAGTDELSPMRMEKAMTLYDQGCETIMAYGDNIRKAVLKAAVLRGKTVVSAGCDARSESDQIIMGTLTDSGNAVTAALTQCDQKDFKGGTSDMYGMKEGSVGLAIDFSRFTGFTEDIYNAEAAKLSSGAVTVPETEQTSGNTQVTVAVTEE